MASTVLSIIAFLPTCIASRSPSDLLPLVSTSNAKHSRLLVMFEYLTRTDIPKVFEIFT